MNGPPWSPSKCREALQSMIAERIVDGDRELAEKLSALANTALESPAAIFAHVKIIAGPARAAELRSRIEAAP